MSEEFEPEDFEDDDSDLTLPSDAEDWEIPILSRLHKLMPKKEIYLPKDFKHSYHSSKNAVFYEEDPILFPEYEKVVRKIMKIARNSDKNSKITCEAVGTTLDLSITADSFDVGGNEACSVFEDVFKRKLGMSVGVGYDPDTITLSFFFPKAWRVVK